MNKRAAVAIVVFAALFVVWAVSQWRQVADLRAHGVEVTAKVVTVKRSGKTREALLGLPKPGGGETAGSIDLWPLSKVAEGNLIEVTYDPADPDMLQRGWGIDYATPSVVTVIAVATIVGAVFAVRAAATGRSRPVTGQRRWPPSPPARRWKKPVRPRRIKRRT